MSGVRWGESSDAAIPADRRSRCWQAYDVFDEVVSDPGTYAEAWVAIMYLLSITTDQHYLL